MNIHLYEFIFIYVYIHTDTHKPPSSAGVPSPMTFDSSPLRKIAVLSHYERINAKFRGHKLIT
jgi:hypothetical protein